MTDKTLSNFEIFTDKKAFDQGRALFIMGWVTDLDEFEPDCWTAEVIGDEQTCRTWVDLEGDRVESCDCDCMSGDQPACKHVVATLMAIRAHKTRMAPKMRKGPLRRGRKPSSTAPTTVVHLEAEPKPRNEPPDSLLGIFDQMPEETEKRLLRIAALIWGYFSQAQMHDSFHMAGFRHNGLPLEITTVQKFLTRMKSAGFFKTDNRNWFVINPLFAQLLCDRDYNRHPDFKQAVTGIRKKMNSGWGYYIDPDELFRDMRIARYENDPEEFIRKYETLLQSFPQKHSGASLLQFWLDDAFDVRKLESFESGIRFFLVRQCVYQTIIHLKPPDGYFDFAVANIDQVSPEIQPAFVTNCLLIYLFQGDWRGVGRMKAKLPPLDELEINGILEFIGGDIPVAREIFDSTMKLKRKSTGYAKANLSPFAGIFQVLSYFQTRDPALYAKADSIIKAGTSSSGLYYPAFNFLEAVALFLKSEKKSALQHFQNARQVFPVLEFFKFQFQFWVDIKAVDTVELARYHEKVKSVGYRWLAAESGFLLNLCLPGNDRLARETAEEIDDLVIEPMANLLPRIEEWENALAVLSQMGHTVKSAAPETGKRLVWIVNFKYGLISPKEQAFSKKGWTGGKTVTFQRLHSGALDFLTPQDMRIVSEIPYSGSQARLSDQVLRALVDHPLLFLAQSPETAIQLQEEKPLLLIQPSKGGYQLKFSHEFDREGAQVLKESPVRYKLLNITAEYAKIARAFNGNQLFVPEKGLEQLKTALEGVAKIITVRSPFDAEDTSLPSVPSDSRICVHLLPVGEGFHVELFVKPFTATHPYFKPGAGEANVATLIEGQKTRTARDLAVEKKNEAGLRKQIGLFQEKKPKNSIWEVEDAEECLRLLAELEPMVQNQRILLEWPKGEKFRVAMLAGPDAFEMRIDSEADWFSVSGSLKVDEEKVFSMQQLLELSRQNGQFIELSPGKFLALTQEFRRRLASINGLFVKGKGNSLRLHPLAAPALEPFTEGLKNVAFDRKFKENRERIQNAFGRQFKLPVDFKATLRAYQTEGYTWLRRCAEAGLGACLADDMGLGKTIQALALLTERGALGPALVAAPASVCRNWVSEAARFAPGMNPILFGEGDRAVAIDQAGKNDLVIVTYDLMARESAHFIRKEWSTVLLDEAQSIKNRTTKRSETAMQLSGDFRLIMTGTPLENHLGELWNLFQFINPGLLGSIESFNERFAIPIEKFRDENRREQLRRLVQPFILRRRKDDVLKELPAKTEITLTVSLPPEERAFYEALRRNAIQKLENDDSAGGEKHLRILAEIMRLRRAACHPILVDVNAGFKESAKLLQFGEIVDELLENKHKALVFSQFVTHLEILETYLKEKKIAYQYLDGSTPLATRQKRIEAFQAGEGDLFLISLKAGGVGLNLTAADYVIHMDPWWNPAVEDQATDRAHRIGQEKPVTVYRLVAEDTIEEKILKLHERKRDLADSLLEGADMSARLTADELLGLMKR